MDAISKQSLTVCLSSLYIDYPVCINFGQVSLRFVPGVRLMAVLPCDCIRLG